MALWNPWTKAPGEGRDDWGFMRETTRTRCPPEEGAAGCFIEAGRGNGVSERVRTSDLPLRRGPLYPDELRGQICEKAGMIAGESLWLKVLAC